MHVFGATLLENISEHLLRQKGQNAKICNLLPSHVTCFRRIDHHFVLQNIVPEPCLHLQSTLLYFIFAPLPCKASVVPFQYAFP